MRWINKIYVRTIIFLKLLKKNITPFQTFKYIYIYNIKNNTRRIYQINNISHAIMSEYINSSHEC